ncbi:hypothetical protein CAEBREN_09676 [Caenorhabditis brenneri]|uniref:Uncharacterized protein n=1 Tax=Caenorhabditis brenneri TaxID=135651 RepID=G0MH44_CAEBE|nr:hypothetical protein CAEBREN_09676 [Caenorhabditis brenneri]
MAQEKIILKKRNTKIQEKTVEEPIYEDGEPDDLLKEIVFKPKDSPDSLNKPIYGPPPYPSGFSLSKTSGHYGSLFAPIPGFAYSKKPTEPPTRQPSPARTAVVSAVPRQITHSRNVDQPSHYGHSYPRVHTVPHPSWLPEDELQLALAPYQYVQWYALQK